MNVYLKIIAIASACAIIAVPMILLMPTGPHLGAFKWYHQIDCSQDANALACNHIAQECLGTALIAPDGIRCYGD